MKKPTLRLRQVFEGPTHFKVVKPLGNPIKIAKKGLSPNLMGRLRKFATAGEVTEPVYGSGSVSEQLDQVRRDIENEAQRSEPSVDVLGMLREREQQLANLQSDENTPPVTVPKTFLAPQTDRLVRDGVGSFEAIKASGVAQEPIEKLGPGEDITVNGTATPSPAPRMVATPEAQRMGPFEEIAPVMRRAVVSEEQPVAPVAAVPVRRSPAIVPEIAGAPGAATVEMRVASGSEPAPSSPAVAASKEEDLTPVQYARQLIKEELGQKNPNPDILRQYFDTLKDAVAVERAERKQSSQVPVAAAAAGMSDLDWINSEIAKEMNKPKPDNKVLAQMVADRDEYLSAVAKAPVAAAAAPAMSTTPSPVAVPAAAAPATAVAPVAPAVVPVVVPAAPAAAVVEKPAVVKIPQTLDLSKPITLEAFREFKAANKGLANSDAALALIRQYTPDAAPLGDIKLLDTPPPTDANKDAVARFDEAKDNLARSLVEQAKVDYDTNRQILEANQRAQAQRLLNAEKDQATADALIQRRDSLREAVEGGFKPESLYGSNDLGRQIGSALSIALGAFASGMTGMPNYALKIYEDAVSRDLDVQKSRYNSLVNQYNRLLGDAADAEKLARADLNDLAALQVEGIKASSAVRGVGPAADRMIAELQAKAAKEREEVAIKQSEAREAKVKADLAQETLDSQNKYRNAMANTANARAAVVGKPGGLAEERFKLLQAKWVEGRKFSVPDPTDPTKSIYINAPSPAIAKEKVGEITQRTIGLMQLEDFENWLKANASKPVSEDAIKEMQVKIAGIVENYPGTVRGSKNLVTVAQSKLLKPAITSTTIPIIQFMDVLGLTSTAMKEIRTDANRGVIMAVRGAASEGDPGLADFASKFTASGYRGRGPYGGEPAALAADKARVRAADGKVYVIDKAKLPDALKVPGVTEVK